MAINKVVYGGQTLIDLTSDTVTSASHIMEGYVGHLANGTQVTGTGQGGGAGAISVVDTQDSAGGTIRTITAVDISDTTATASDVATGKVFYTADGTQTTGTASGGGGSSYTAESPITIKNNVIGFDGYNVGLSTATLFNDSYTNVNDTITLSGTLSTEVGAEATITIDGVVYDCACFDDNGYPTYGGSYQDFSEYPFNLYFENGWHLVLSDDNEHTVKIEALLPSCAISEDFSFAVNSILLCKNLIDGSAEGSVRNIFAREESETYTLGEHAHAEGLQTTASGDSSHAEGDHTTASGNYSHAECDYTTASGTDSHAEGYAATASGDSSHAEGNCTTASGNSSHAEGLYTTASGSKSHAEGSHTTASGSDSHAEGLYTTAKHESQHVFGEYNVEDPSTASATARGTYIEIVGNGTSDSAKSNARTLDWSGNEVLQGSLTLGKGTADETTITATQLKALLALLQ